MAAESSVTEDGLKTKIKNLLQATYVDIEDMSGIFTVCPTTPRQHSLTCINRRLWPGILSCDSIAPVREENLTGAQSTSQFGAEDRNRCNSRLEPQMLYTGTMGSSKARGQAGYCAWEKYDRRSG
jgi:hypothetical protein